MQFFHLPVAGFCKHSIVGILWQEHFRQKKNNHVRERQSDISYDENPKNFVGWWQAHLGKDMEGWKHPYRRKLVVKLSLRTCHGSGCHVVDVAGDMAAVAKVPFWNWTSTPFFFVISSIHKLGKPMFMGIFHGINCRDLQWWVKKIYHLVMTNSSPWYRWP